MAGLQLAKLIGRASGVFRTANATATVATAWELFNHSAFR